MRRLIFLIILFPFTAKAEPLVWADFVDQPAHWAVERIAREAGVKVRLPADMDYLVTARFDGVSFEAALTELLRPQLRGWRRVKHRVYEVLPLASIHPKERLRLAIITNNGELGNEILRAHLETVATYEMLELAVGYDRLEIANRLYDAGARLDPTSGAADRNGNSPLRRAASAGRVDLVELRLKYGANAESPNERGERPLHLASSSPGCQQILLAFGADPNAADPDGDRPLHRACQSPAGTLLLLDHGANPKLVDGAGRTPLHRTNCRLVADFLLERGADVNALADDGSTPTTWATGPLREFLEDRGGRVLMPASVIPAERGRRLLVRAVRTGRAELVKVLLEAGVSPRDRGKAQWNPVLGAADPEFRDRGGDSIFEIAVEFGSLEVVEILLDHGASVTEPGTLGWTPLHLAAAANRLELARFFLERGASPAARNDLGFTPIQAARTPEMRTLLEGWLRKQIPPGGIRPTRRKPT